MPDANKKKEGKEGRAKHTFDDFMHAAGQTELMVLVCPLPISKAAGQFTKVAKSEPTIKMTSDAFSSIGFSISNLAFH